MNWHKTHTNEKQNCPITKVHCLFEQSGTFKKQFIDMGIPAVDYDLRNNFGQTDYQIDLFTEIENAYDDKPSIFDDIMPTDLIMAFFPCIYFEALQMTYYTTECNNLTKKSDKEKFDIVINRVKERERFYILLYKLVGIVKIRSLRMIIENPATQPHYLLFSENFIKPTFVDNNRQRRGDYFRKPTAYWFINIDRTFGESFVKPSEIRTVQKCRAAPELGGGKCSEERSIISPTYARNFICDFILGRKTEHSQMSLFDALFNQ